MNCSRAAGHKSLSLFMYYFCWLYSMAIWPCNFSSRCSFQSTAFTQKLRSFLPRRHHHVCVLHQRYHQKLNMHHPVIRVCLVVCKLVASSVAAVVWTQFCCIQSRYFPSLLSQWCSAPLRPSRIHSYPFSSTPLSLTSTSTCGYW